MAFFVYVKKNGKIFPQRFDEWPTVDGKPLVAEKKFEITQRDLGMKLKALVRKYPLEDKSKLT